MDRLSIILTLAVGAVITGGTVIAAFSLGFYSWWAVVVAAIMGLVLSWPVSYQMSWKIKESDPHFDHTRVRRTGPLPDPGAREV